MSGVADRSDADGRVQRAELIARIFPEGLPRLWCPPLAHYGSSGALDRERQKLHFLQMCSHVGAFLVPGSTTDGWELTRPERAELLADILRWADELGVRVLIGALHAESAVAAEMIAEVLESGGVPSSNGQWDWTGPVCGFAICPPRRSGLSQQEIGDGLARVLALGVPTALYQLPQVTQNEMSPELVCELARRFPNFFLFKDSSGTDTVANAGLDYGGVWMVRGAESDYHRWLKASGGPYDGFLLSTANCFAPQLNEIIAAAASGQADRAEQLSRPITELVSAVFSLVAKVPQGNAFANANKAIDHWLAFGPAADEIAPPYLRGGVPMPAAVISETGRLLRQHRLMPAEGYWIESIQRQP
jgi:dihydrodipicolinate synthase/N-acetylneuraminate lyase